jgi:hypothetical protein
MDVYVINGFHPIRITRHVAAVTGLTYSGDYGALEMLVINEHESPSDTVALALQRVVFEDRGTVIPHPL